MKTIKYPKQLHTSGHLITMIHSACEVILQADHSPYGQEPITHVTLLTVANMLILEDTSPTNIRLDLRKLWMDANLILLYSILINC